MLLCVYEGLATEMHHLGFCDNHRLHLQRQGMQTEKLTYHSIPTLYMHLPHDNCGKHALQHGARLTDVFCVATELLMFMPMYDTTPPPHTLCSQKVCRSACGQSFTCICHTRCHVLASVARRSNTSLMKLFMMFIALLLMPVSECTCFSTL